MDIAAAESFLASIHGHGGPQGQLHGPGAAAPAEWDAIFHGQVDGMFSNMYLGGQHAPTAHSGPRHAAGRHMPQAHAVPQGPHALHGPMGAQWEAAWQQRHAVEAHGPVARPAPGGWAEEFAAQHRGHMLPPAAARGAAWAREFAAAAPAGPASSWAEDFAQEEAWEAQQAPGRAPVDARAAAGAITKALGRSTDPKMRNSQFMQFMSKVGRGELTFRDNKVVEQSPQVDSWASEFGAQPQQPQHAPGPSGATWAQDFLSAPQQPAAAGAAWAGEFSAEGPQGHAPGWAAEYEQEEGREAAHAARAPADARESAAAIARALGQSADPKMRNWQFMQFVSKVAEGAPASSWAHEFGSQQEAQHAPQHQRQQAGPAPAAWAGEFTAQPHASAQPAPAAWAEEFAAPAAPWAAEYAESEAAARQEQGQQQEQQQQGQPGARSSMDVRASTAAIARALGESANPRMRNSQFLGLVQRLAAGEVALGDKQLVEGSAQAAAWAGEFGAQQEAPAPAPQHQHPAQRHRAPPAGWAQEFGAQLQGPAPAAVHVGSGWAGEYAAAQPAAASGAWAEDSAAQQQGQQPEQQADAPGRQARRAAADPRAVTAAIARALGQSANPKMRSSQFLHFVNRVEKGEVSLADGKASEGVSWAGEFGAQQSTAVPAA